MAIEEGLRRLRSIGSHEPGIGLGADQAEDVNPPPFAAEVDLRLPEIHLGMARRVIQWYEGFTRRPAPIADIALHNGVAAGEAVLIP